MKKWITALAFLLPFTFLGGCMSPDNGNKPNEKDVIVSDVVDLEDYDDYGQEMNTNYKFFWKPSQKDGYVGDVMPYYENGVYSLFYLKDEGGSLRHSIYRVDTTDFIHYMDKGETLRSGFITQQDYWIGTGSIVKAKDDYYLFYTGHNPQMGDVWENVMVAKSCGNLDNFEKISDFKIAPPQEFSQKDFRDPQAFYNAEENCFDVTVETNSLGVARIIRYKISLDLTKVEYKGEVYSDTTGMKFWNLECVDITKQNGKYFMTFSGQPYDSVWYTVSDNMFSGYSNPIRLEGKHFYAPKVVEGDKGTFLVGWVYRREQFKDESNLYWGGNIVAHKMIFNEDNTITLAKVDNLDSYFSYEEKLNTNIISFTNEAKSTKKLCDAKESYMVTGNFTYTGKKNFGLVLGHKDEFQRYVRYNPEKKMLQFALKDNIKSECEIAMDLKENTNYTFTYIQEGSICALYIDGVGVLSFRCHGTNNTQTGLFSDGSVVEFNNLKQYLRGKKEG